MRPFALGILVIFLLAAAPAVARDPDGSLRARQVAEEASTTEPAAKDGANIPETPETTPNPESAANEPKEAPAPTPKPDSEFLSVAISEGEPVKDFSWAVKAIVKNPNQEGRIMTVTGTYTGKSKKLFFGKRLIKPRKDGTFLTHFKVNQNVGFLKVEARFPEENRTEVSYLLMRTEEMKDASLPSIDQLDKKLEAQEVEKNEVKEAQEYAEAWASAQRAAQMGGAGIGFDAGLGLNTLFISQPRLASSSQVMFKIYGGMRIPAPSWVPLPLSGRVNFDFDTLVLMNSATNSVMRIFSVVGCTDFTFPKNLGEEWEIVMGLGFGYSTALTSPFPFGFRHVFSAMFDGSITYQIDEQSRVKAYFTIAPLLLQGLAAAANNAWWKFGASYLNTKWIVPKGTELFLEITNFQVSTNVGDATYSGVSLGGKVRF